MPPGRRICYYQNNIRRKSGQYYCTLTLTLDLPHDNDTVWVAMCYPYTYTDLQRDLLRWEEDPQRSHRTSAPPTHPPTHPLTP